MGKTTNLIKILRIIQAPIILIRARTPRRRGQMEVISLIIYGSLWQLIRVATHQSKAERIHHLQFSHSLVMHIIVTHTNLGTSAENQMKTLIRTCDLRITISLPINFRLLEPSLEITIKIKVTNRIILLVLVFLLTSSKKNNLQIMRISNNWIRKPLANS